MENKIYAICKMVKDITNEEFKDCRTIADDQLNYTHPFLHATAKKQRDLGKHNHAVLDALQALKAVIDSGEDLVD